MVGFQDHLAGTPWREIFHLSLDSVRVSDRVRKFKEFLQGRPFLWKNTRHSVPEGTVADIYIYTYNIYLCEPVQIHKRSKATQSKATQSNVCAVVQ